MRGQTESPLPGAPATITEAGGSIAVVTADDTLLVGPAEGQLTAAPSSEPVRLAALDQQGQLVADATGSGVVEVRNLGGSGDPFRAGQVTGTPSAVAVSARRGLVLGAGSQRFGFTLWDIADGDALADVSSGDVLGIVYAASFDESGDRLVVSDGSTGDLLVWSVDPARERHRRAAGAPARRRPCGPEPAVAGDRVVAVDEGGVVRQFSLSSGRPPARRCGLWLRSVSHRRR